MTEPQSKKENVEARKDRERREKLELRGKRELQLADAEKAIETLQDQLKAGRSFVRRCDALLNHSDGFYQVVDKLAKGKALLEVTTLVMEQANDIIRDAKEIVKDDVYMDRIKEFVAAGDNPVYPDVLVSIRSVRDSLGRSRKARGARLRVLKGRLSKAQTLIGALAYFLNDEEADDDDRNYPTKKAIMAYVDGDVSDSCFSRYRDSNEQYFDFETLDQRTVPEYLSMSEVGETDGGFAEADHEEPDGDSDDPDFPDGSEEEEEEDS
jgi:hypothetical protein